MTSEPSEEELRAAYEAELSRIAVTDMMAQACVSLLNLAARRLGPPPGAPAEQGGEEDLEQARDGIDGARALLEILERRMPAQARGLRDALSQLQMAYARKVGTGSPGGPTTPPAQGDQKAGEQGQERPAGPAESSGRLWVPGR